MVGVVKLFPVETGIPPVAVVYQLIRPTSVVACRFTLPGLHLETFDEATTGVMGVLFTTAITDLRFDSQPAST
ncbi:hypothetical protein D3C87_1684730 [compost metagenome]